MGSSTETRQLVVLGMHRSGTSAVAGILSTLGFSAGAEDSLMPAQEDNPLGFWERVDVVELNDRILEANGGSWFNVPAVCKPRKSDTKRARAIVKQLGTGPALLKDPRMLLTWPVWEQVLADPVLVFVYRSPEAVASSLQRRNGFPLDYGLALWEYYTRTALGILDGKPFVGVSYEALVSHPAETLQAMAARLAAQGYPVEVRPDALAECFDAGLDHSAEAAAAVAGFLTDAQRELAEHTRDMLAMGIGTVYRVPASQALQPRIANYAAAYGFASRAMQQGKKLENVSGELEHLRQVHGVVQADRQRLLEEMGERQELLDRYHALESDHNALAEAHRNDGEELARLRQEREKLLSAHQEAYRVLFSQVEKAKVHVASHERTIEQLNAKADFLYDELGGFFQRAEEFDRSLLGRMTRWLGHLYKLVRGRSGTHTPLESLVAEARHRFPRGADADAPPPGKLRMLWRVLVYVARNPAGSRRSFSLARLRRAISVFFGADRADLATWVSSRFPDAANGEELGLVPSLSDDLDNLELAFPVVDDPRVSIVIPVYNEYRMTLFCLRSLLENHAGVSYEVIIADDASTDLTTSLEERVSGVRVVRGDENRGFVRNCNAGAEAARGEYLLFLNNDTGFTELWLRQLCEVLDSRPGVGIVGPRLLFGNGEQQEAGGIIWDDASGWNYGRLDDMSRPEYNYLRSTDYVSGACLPVPPCGIDSVAVPISFGSGIAAQHEQVEMAEPPAGADCGPDQRPGALGRTKPSR
ncbi:MAG: glycosyltransferase, partial [Halioglobus sp.]